MSQIILVGFSWGLAFAVSFVVLGYPTFLSLLFGILGGWAWSGIVTYWTSEDEAQGLPSYLKDIDALREELSNIGTGGRIDLHKAQRRRDAKAARILRQSKLRQQQLRHRGRPTTMRDRLVALRYRLLPPKKKGDKNKGEPDYAAILARLEAQGAEIDAQLKNTNQK
jgi:hypothetical protein